MSLMEAKNASELVYNAYYSQAQQQKYGCSYRYVIRETGEEQVVSELRLQGKLLVSGFCDSKYLGTVTSEGYRGLVRAAK